MKSSRKTLLAIFAPVLVVLIAVGAFFGTGQFASIDSLLATTLTQQDSEGEGDSESEETSSSSASASTEEGHSDAEGIGSHGEVDAAPQNAPESSPNNGVAPSENTLASEQPMQPSMISVSVTIDAARGGGASYTRTVVIPAGSSVYNALVATGASLAGTSNYVASIDGLAEKSQGSGSGWFYFVNGVSPSMGCGGYILSGGENIRWVFTLDMGRDL